MISIYNASVGRAASEGGLTAVGPAFVDSRRARAYVAVSHAAAMRAMTTLGATTCSSRGEDSVSVSLRQGDVNVRYAPPTVRPSSEP